MIIPLLFLCEYVDYFFLKILKPKSHPQKKRINEKSASYRKKQPHTYQETILYYLFQTHVAQSYGHIHMTGGLLICIGDCLLSMFPFDAIFSSIEKVVLSGCRGRNDKIMAFFLLQGPISSISHKAHVACFQLIQKIMTLFLNIATFPVS